MPARQGFFHLLSKLRPYHLSPSGLVRISCHLLSGIRLCRKHSVKLSPYLPACLNSMTTIWNYSQRGLPAPGTIIDVGANDSQMTRLIQILAPQSRVLSFEPNPACHPIGEVHRFALSDEDGRGTLYVTHDDYGSTMEVHRPDSAQQVVVETRRFDSLGIRVRDLPRPVLLKVDVEGYELKVLRGLGEELSAVDAAIIEVQNHRDQEKLYDATELYAHLRQHGLGDSTVLFAWFTGTLPPEYMDVLFART